MKQTKYRIAEFTGRVRTWVTDFAYVGGTDHYFVWAHDVKKATVFDSREDAIQAAERIEARIRTWRSARPEHAKQYPRPNPVRIIPTTGGNWVEWTPAAAESAATFVGYTTGGR